MKAGSGPAARSCQRGWRTIIDMFDEAADDIDLEPVARAPVAVELWGEPIFDPSCLRRIVLRYFLSELLATHTGRVWTPTELGEALAARGFHVGGRPAKEISDALRAEVNRGRVLRVGRGRYRSGTVPGATRRRMRSVVRHRQAVLARELAREQRHRFT
jgi:hypothetical protein